MKFIETKIEGCFLIDLLVREDNRGNFVKTFHEPTFTEHGLETNFVEEYFSKSVKNVVRGMHFQVPPAEHVKIVRCTEGEIFDVVLDLRKGSSTYLRHQSFRLNAAKPQAVYIPKGLAHGFAVTSDISEVCYKVSTAYDPKCDTGIYWHSVDIDWPVNIEEAITSDRDKQFVELKDFESPF